MKKIIGLVCVVLFFSGCYFNNTTVFLTPEGFHVADSPFVAGDHAVTGIANNGSTVVAVSNDGVIAYSPDSGVTWTRVEAENIVDNFLDGIRFNAVAWGGGWFLAAGDEGRAAYSADGIRWQAGVIGPMSPKDIYCVAAGSLAGKTVFAAAGTDGRMAHATDSPAGPWYMDDVSTFGSADYYAGNVYALAWGEIKGRSVFVAAGDRGKIAFLRDLSGKWYSNGRAGTGETFRSVAYGNDRFIAVGNNGLIKYSLDPLNSTWVTVKDSVFGLRYLNGIAFDPVINHFISYSDDTIVGVSEFGESWNASNFQSRLSGGGGNDPERISAISCTAFRIILGGSRGTIAYSN